MTAGVKSTALLFGDRTKLVLSGFAGASTGLLAIAGAVAYHRCSGGHPRRLCSHDCRNQLLDDHHTLRFLQAVDPAEH